MIRLSFLVLIITGWYTYIYRLEVEAGRSQHKPIAVPLNERKCRACLNCLEDEFHFLLELPLYHEFRKNI